MSLSRERTLWQHRHSRTVSPAAIKIVDAISSTPDDHFTAGPHCRVLGSAGRRVGSASGCPTIRAGIVSPAGVKIADATTTTTAPHDHFGPDPDCRVVISRNLSLVDGSSCLTVV